MVIKKTLKAKIRFIDGKIACCSQVCDDTCLHYTDCQEYDISIRVPVQNSSKFFANTECEYYPCHFEGQNCLFCFCVLYHLDCPGDYTILKNGCKDCTDCVYPHIPENYEKIIELLK